MARVYTRRLYSGAPAERYASVAVPAGKRWIVRDIQARANVATGVDVLIQGLGFVATLNLAGANGRFFSVWDGRVALNAGETLIVDVGVAGTSVTITGYEFDV